MSTSAIKSWNNGFSHGLSSSAIVADESGDIRVVMFNEACKKLMGEFVIGHTIEITGFECKAINETYRATTSDIDLRLNDFSTVCRSQREVESSFRNYATLAECMEKPLNQVINVAGVISGLTKTQMLKGRNQKECKRRELRLEDDTGLVAIVELWNEDCEKVNGCEEEVMFVTNVRICKINDGVRLKVTDASRIEISPNSIQASKMLFKARIVRSEVRHRYILIRDDTCKNAKLSLSFVK